MRYCPCLLDTGTPWRMWKFQEKIVALLKGYPSHQNILYLYRLICLLGSWSNPDPQKLLTCHDLFVAKSSYALSNHDRVSVHSSNSGCLLRHPASRYQATQYLHWRPAACQAGGLRPGQTGLLSGGKGNRLRASQRIYSCKLLLKVLQHSNNGRKAS